MKLNLPTWTDPIAEPVTLAQLRAHVVTDAGDQDGLLLGYLIAARTHVETLIDRPILSRAVSGTAECWPGDGKIEIFMPVTGVTGITYTNAAGAETPWTDFITRKGSGGSTIIRPASGAGWPVLGDDPVITVTAVSGFARAPESLVMAICQLAAHWFAVRESVNVGNIVSEVPMTTLDLVAPFRWVFVG